MEKSELTALVDCDILRFRCGFAADSQIKKEAAEAEPGAGEERIKEMMQDIDYTAVALQNVKTTLENITEQFNGQHELYIHGEGNFRYELATLKPYKGNRDQAHKPKYFKEIKDYIVETWDAIVVNEIESDDALGIRQYEAKDNTCIVSNDKDMDMIPGYHFNWVKNDFYFIEEREANLMLFWQMLVGDTSDNIPGITNVGPKTASKLLSDVQSCEEALAVVTPLYEKQYGDKAPMIMNEIANLLWIRRHLHQDCPFV